MNTISNILQLMRFYWRTEKKLYLRLFLMFFSIFLVKTAVIDFIIMNVDTEVYNFSHTAIHAYIYTGGTLITLSYLFDAIHHKQRAINYLSLPASNIEKFLSRYILGVVGVPLLINASMLGAAGVVTLFLKAVDSMLSYQPSSWESIFNYYYVSFHYTTFKEALMGIRPWSSYFLYCFWTYTVELAFFSAFIWCGIAFRKAGWVYAFIANFVLMALIVLILEISGAADYHTPPIAKYMVRDSSIVFILLFIFLAYRSFCHAQIVNRKFFTL